MNDREKLIARAIREQRISAHQAGEYRRLYDAQPAAIQHLLTASVENGGLMPGLVANSDALDAAYDPAWLTARERSALSARPTASPRPPVAPPAAPVPAQATTAPTTPAPGAGDDDEYAGDWLSPKERSRIAAAKEGTLAHGPVQFEDDGAKAATGVVGS